MSNATLEQAAELAEWHAWRATGLGASDIPAIMGLSPHRTPLDVYMDKTGQGRPVVETLAMFLGKAAEPRILDDYRRLTGHELVAEQVRVTSEAKPFMRATLDAVRDDSLIVECKLLVSRSTREFGDEGTDELPESFLAQGHAQMYAADVDRMHFAVASASWPDPAIYEVVRSERFTAMMLDAADEMWDRVLSRNPPPFSLPSDIRHVPALFGDEGPTVEFGDEEALLWAQYVGLGKVASSAEKERDAFKTQLFNRLGPASAGVFADGSRIARKLVTRKEHIVKASEYAQLRFTKGI